MSKVISVAAALQHCTGLHDSTQVMGLLQGAVPSCLARVLPWGISMFPFAFCLPVGSIPGWHKWSFHQLVDMSIDWSASRASSSSFSAFVTDRRAGVSSPAGMPALVLAWRGSHACLESCMMTIFWLTLSAGNTLYVVVSEGNLDHGMI